MISEPEPLNVFNSIGVVLAADSEEEPLEAYFWKQYDTLSPWNINWTESVAYGGGLELDDSVFGNSWTQYWGAHAWFDCDLEEPCVCEEHICLGTHSTKGHTAAAAETSQSVPVLLIVIESLTLTPSEIDPYDRHWSMCVIRCNVRIRPTQTSHSGVGG